MSTTVLLSCQLLNPNPFYRDKITEVADGETSYYDEDFINRYSSYVNLALIVLSIIRGITVIAYLRWPGVARYHIYIQGLLNATLSLTPINYGAMPNYV